MEEIIRLILSSPWWLLLVALGVPPILTHRMEKRYERREALRISVEEERARNRADLELVLIESVNASLTLAEATAKAIQRIPDAHCNGDMHSALEYTTTVKRKQKEFLTKLGVNSLYDNQD